MFSNSKLTAGQKIERKDRRRNLPPGFTMANNQEVTLLAIPDGSVTRIFSAVMSTDEIKFRRKVGEYWVMSRFFNNAGGGLILPGSWTAQHVMNGLMLITQM